MALQDFTNWKLKSKFFTILIINMSLLLLLSISLFYALHVQKETKEKIVENSEAIFYFMDGDMMHEGLRGDVIKVASMVENSMPANAISAKQTMDVLLQIKAKLDSVKGINNMSSYQLKSALNLIETYRIPLNNSSNTTNRKFDEQEFKTLKAEFEGRVNQFLTDIENIGKLKLSASVLDEFKNVKEPLENYITSAKTIFEIAEKHDRQLAFEITAKSKQFLIAFKVLEIAQEKVSEAMLADADKLKSDSNHIENVLYWFNVIFTVTAFVIILLISRKIIDSIISNLEKTKLGLNQISNGNIAKQLIVETKDEFGEMLQSMNKLNSNLSKVKEFAHEVGKGKFDNEISVFDNQGELGKALSEMRDSLQQVAISESQRNWAVQGIAQISELLRNAQDTSTGFYDGIMKFVINYLGANQGGIFILNDEDSNELFLELKGCYAYERKKYVEKKILIGEGLVGQTFREGESIYLTEVPKNYIHISSGLGEATPTSVILVPMKLNDAVNGVLEVASFKTLEKYQIEFLEKVAESISSTIKTLKINVRTINLLEHSQQQTEELKAQEEEMRQNLEEMQATQEEMHRTLSESNKTKAIIQQTLEQALDGVISINRQKEIIFYNQAAEKMFGYTSTEVMGKNIKMIVPESIQAEHDSYVDNNINTGVNKVVGVARELEANDKHGNKFWILLSLSKIVINDYIQYTAFIKDITIQKNSFDEMVKLKSELETRVKMLDKICIVSETDAKGQITYVNDKFLKVAKYQMDELVGQPHNIVRHPDTPKEVFKEMWATIGRGNSFRGYIKNKAKDGTPYWVDAVIAPVIGKSGKPEKYIGIRFDITEMKLKEDALNLKIAEQAKRISELEKGN